MSETTAVETTKDTNRSRVAGASPAPQQQRPAAGAPDRDLLALHDKAGNRAVGQLVDAYGRDTTASEPGRALDETSRHAMEATFGQDVGRVRLHTGSTGGQVAAQHNAHAVTIGHDIFFAAGEFAPGTTEGRAVLGHEVAHAMQFTNGQGRGSSPAAQLESEATMAGLQLAAGQRRPKAAIRPAKVEGSASGQPLALTRGEKAGIGAGVGAGVGLALGGIGLAIAAAAGAALGGGAIIAALLGGAVLGAALGALIGGLQRRTTPVTPDEADRLIRDRYGDNLTAAIAAGTQAQGNIQVVDDAAYRVAYAALYGSVDEDYPYVNAFVDRSTTPPTVWIHEERQTPATVLHEALHLYSDSAMRDNYGKQVNEGTTEYFTRLIVEQEHLERRTGIYDDEHEAIRQLVGVIGEDTLREAYFEGDTAALEQAVDNARGAGTFATWLGHMQAEDWDEANDALAAAP